MTRRDFVRRGALWLPAAAAMGQQIVVVKKKAGGGGLAAFSDDFNRADSDSLGANWTEHGDMDILSNTLSVATTSYAWTFAIYATDVTTISQYAYVTFPAGADEYPQVVFRFTNDSSPFYHVEVDGYIGLVKFFQRSSLGGTSTQIGSDGSTGGGAIAGQSYGFTITGTGASTAVRVWKNPTGTTPTSATNWGGDTTPDAVWTTDPGGLAVNTGLKVGIGGQNGSANRVRFDFWAGGDIP
jgi:hypothetical protein